MNSFYPWGSGGTLETWQQGIAKLFGILKFWCLETNARVGYRWTLLGPPPSQIHLHFSLWCGRTDFSQRDQMLVLRFSTLDPSCQNFSLSPTTDLGGSSGGFWPISFHIHSLKIMALKSNKYYVLSKYLLRAFMRPPGKGTAAQLGRGQCSETQGPVYC